MKTFVALPTLALLVSVPFGQAVAAQPASLSIVQKPVAIGSVPKGAQRVPFLALTLSASCAADVTLDSLTLTHDGLGAARDLERVYVLDARGRRVTRARPVDDANRTVSLRFAPPLTIDACDAASVTVAADIAADAATAGQHRLLIDGAADVAADAAVSVASVTDADAATVRPRTVGSIGATFLGLRGTLWYGSNRTLARFRLEADGEADQEVSSITFTNAGKAADGDLKNLRVVNSRGTTLTNVAPRMDGDTVTLAFDPPLRLDRNHDVLLELRGDVRASVRKTVRFTIEEPSDLVAAPRRANRSR